MPGVPRSTCYWMTGHPGTERVDPVAGDVRAVWRDSRGRYGARKIKAASLSSAKTVPHVPDSMFVAEMMLRLS